MDVKKAKMTTLTIAMVAIGFWMLLELYYVRFTCITLVFSLSAMMIGRKLLEEGKNDACMLMVGVSMLLFFVSLVLWMQYCYVPLPL